MRLQSEHLTIDPPEMLLKQVLRAVDRKRRMQARMHLAIASAGSLSFGALFGVTLKAMIDAFSVSGFSAYASLVFSDAGSVALYWRELSYSLVESLPVVVVLACITTALLLWGSLRIAVLSMRSSLVIAR